MGVGLFVICAQSVQQVGGGGGGGGIWGILPHKNFIFPESESGVIWKYIIFNNTRTLLVEATLAALWLASLTMSIVNTALIASQSCFSCIILL